MSQTKQVESEHTLPPLRAAMYLPGEPLPANDPPRLHQSLAAVMMNRSPLHAWFKAFGPKEGESEEYRPAANLGSVAHELLLGGRRIVEVPADDWKTKAAREARDVALAEGSLPILTGQLSEARAMVEHIRKELAARGIDLTGQSEVTLIWQAPNGVWCEGRLDHVILPQIYLVSKNGKRRRRARKFLHGEILDFKFTSVDASKKKCEIKIAEYGYDIQNAAYIEAVETVFPELAGRVTMRDVFIETARPWAVRVMPLDAQYRAYGETRWRQAQEQWKRYLAELGTEQPWPGYGDDGAPAEVPPWLWNKLVAEMDQFNPEESEAA